MHHYDMKSMARIPDQWARFGPFIAELSQGRPGEAFGVVGRMDAESTGFDYLCGIPAEPVHGLVSMTLPGARYARFTHAGHISTIRATCAAIFGDWLPASGHVQRTDAFSFLEYYGPDFDPVTGLGTVEIWVSLEG
jgi:AraC family transcriptional regulator